MEKLEIYLGSDKAVKSANEFREALEKTAAEVKKIGTAVDKLDKVLDRLGISAKRSSDPVGKVGRSAKKAGEDAKAGARGAKEFDNRLRDLGKRSSRVGNQLRTILAAAGAITGFAAGVNAIVKYEDSLKILGTIAGATGDELKQLEKAAIDTSRNTRFTPRETIEGLTELARAGLTSTEAIQAVKPTADLARVGLIDLSKSSAIVTKSLTQFALGAESAGRVADVLAKGANVSNADVSTLAQSLAKTGPVARKLGIDLEETVAALALLADNGVAASISGTGLQRILLRLRTPTDEARVALLGLGLAVADINPEKVGLVGALENLNRANLKVTDSTQLVDTEFAVLLSVLTDSVGKLKETDESLRNIAGESAKQAAAGVDTLAFAFADLRGASEEFAVASGRRGIGSALTEITKTGAGAIRVLSGDAKAMKEASTQAKVLAASMQTAGTAIAAVLSFRVATYFLTLQKEVGAAAGAMRLLNTVTKANPFVLLATTIGTVVSAMALFGSSASNAEIRARDQADRIDALNQSYKDLQATLETVSKAPGAFSDANSQQQDFEKARAKLLAIGDELEKINQSDPVPIQKILGTAELASAGEEIAKLQELFGRLPNIQAKADEAADAARARSRSGGLSPGENPIQRLIEADAEAQRTRKQFVDATADAFARLGATMDATGQVFVSREKAIEAVTLALKRNDEAAKAANVSIGSFGEDAGIRSAVAGLVAEREKELRLASLVGIEREKALLLSEAEKRAGQVLNEAEQKRLALLAQQTIRRKEDVAARKAAAQLAAKDAQVQRDLPQRLADLQKQYADQLRLAKAESGERANIQGEIRAANDAKAIGLALDSEAFEALKKQAIEAERLRSSKRKGSGSSGDDGRRTELFRGLEQEEKLVQSVGRERERLFIRIEAENEARQAGLVIGSKEAVDYVKRRAAIEELIRSQDELASLGAAAGDSIGFGFERAIFDAEKLRDAIASVGEELARLAFRQTVTNNLSQLLQLAGSSLANYFGGAGVANGLSSSTASPNGTASPFSGAGYNVNPNQMGGIIPAMTGQIVSAPSVLERGGRNYSIAEGGGATPEAVFPLHRDSRGRLGVVGAGGGGGGDITMVFPAVRNAQDARAARSTLGQRIRRLNQADRTGRRGMRPKGL